MALSDTALKLLSAAALRDDQLVEFPARLPAVARNAVIRSLLKQDLVNAVAVPEELLALSWRRDEGGRLMAVRITDVGIQAVRPVLLIEGVPDEPARTGADHQAARSASPSGSGAGDGAMAAKEAMAPPPVSTPIADSPALAPVTRGTLRHAVQALLDAWDRLPKPEAADALVGPIAALRGHLALTPVRRLGGRTRRPREGTKQQQVLALLERKEGISGPDIGMATGWASHTVRGFLAGLKKKGISVEILDRVRQVGPNKEGAKGSYTIYGIVRAD